MPRHTRGSSGGGIRNLPRHSSPRGWRFLPAVWLGYYSCWCVAAASRRGAIRAVARPSRAPLPFPKPVVWGPGRRPSLRFAPAEVVGGKGHRWRGLPPPNFLSAVAVGVNGGLAGAPPSAVAYSPRLLRPLLASRPRPPFLPPALAMFCAISKIRYNRYRSILYRTTDAIVFILKMAKARNHHEMTARYCGGCLPPLPRVCFS